MTRNDSSINLQEYARQLTEKGLSLLVVSRDGMCHNFTRRGVADLLHLYKTSELLCGAIVIDKVVGKGAAALMVLGGVGRVHALVASEPALDLLRQSGIEATCDKAVPNIINRKATGICPVETLCMPCASAAECLPLIESFVKSLKSE